LVPFGEYVPLRGILPLERLVPGRGDFFAGPGPVTLDLAGLPPFSPLICYEGIFPGAVTAIGDRPAWLLNITNDGWFGHSGGPYQHFQAARLRAVEEGLPLVRVANTGISGVVDAYGRTTASLGLGKEGVLFAPLPRPLDQAPPYGRFGDLVFLILLIMSALVAVIASRNFRAQGLNP
ncbi:MAG: apolipoprotein N-acyltransferase, partial [Rhodospirillaceae bacterium]|nr:apolipoprotein N-acyltransferase [Rhodospirillaceae bacterium]